jgi:ribosomal-protein-alanine N-acetyltransferase
VTAAHIREGDAADIDITMSVMVRAFDPVYGEAWTRGQCLGLMSLPDVWLSLAEEGEGGRLVGFALCRLTFDEAELLLLAVDPDRRRSGVGTALIARTCDQATARGARRLLLEVRDDNPAMALYRGAAFDPIGRRAGYYKGPDGSRRDAITLARTLSPTA